MSRGKPIEVMAETEATFFFEEDDDTKPIEVMAEKEATFFFEQDDDIEQKNDYDPQSGGKWILYFKGSSIPSMWAKCCKLYCQSQFPGIKSLKCSTIKYKTRQGTVQKGVIIFHCGPADAQRRMLRYGQNIVDKLNYFNASGYVSYKSDAQSALGTRSTGNTNNSLYKITVPKTANGYSSGASDSSPPRQSSSEEDSSEDLPTDTTDRYWIPKKDYEIAKKYCYDRSRIGYWTMVFNKAWLNKKWLKAVQLYEDGKLTGINSMRVSTAKQFEGKYKFTGTILFYCGPSDDLELVRTYGENLAKLMDYFDNRGRMCYRTDKPKKTLLEIEVQSPWNHR